MEYQTTSSFTYEYFLKDHLGNTRAVVSADGSGNRVIGQVDSYYAFGMAHTGIQAISNPGSDNKYRYNGKELQGESIGGVALDWYDYGWRIYDPQIGRWHVIDPWAEKYDNQSPYLYAHNNPIRYADYLGLGAEDQVDKKEEEAKKKEEEKKKDQQKKEEEKEKEDEKKKQEEKDSYADKTANALGMDAKERKILDEEYEYSKMTLEEKLAYIKKLRAEIKDLNKNIEQLINEKYNLKIQLDEANTAQSWNHVKFLTIVWGASLETVLTLMGYPSTNPGVILSPGNNDKPKL